MSIKSTICALFDAQGRRVSYRRFLVWLTGSVFLFINLIDPTVWLTLSAAYIGGDSLEKIARGWGVKRDGYTS